MMRFDGIIKTWNDERGFGFIEPTQGGQDIFVHIKSFNGLRGRPQPEQRVTFEVEVGPQGKKRAARVELVQTRRLVASRAPQDSPAQWGAATLFVIPAFLVVLLAAHIIGNPPRWITVLYVVASIVTFLAYAGDKAAARKGSWRTSEGSLHTLALVGGWPGALVAQQLLRHKSMKAEFTRVRHQML
jgi:uncharacterized membrane protein YsdA (DUF1294 family)/cold shock CspA family protein